MGVVLELAAGLVAGNLRLAGFSGLEFLKSHAAVGVLSDIAIVVLFFRVGLESTVGEMKRVGLTAVLVAACGIAGSFALGFAVARVLLPGVPLPGQVFLAASLTATSVGVSARVLKDLGGLRTASAHVILGAAVVDDVIGLAVLAAMALSGAVAITLNVSAFLAIGAFAAGLLINEQRSQAIDTAVAPVAAWIVPVFFIVTGLRADLSGLARPQVLVLAAALTAAAVLGKQCCALGVRRAQATHVDRVAVGIGMMPRGEVTLIFATLGLGADAFLAVVITVIVTTLLTPIGLKWRLARQ